ncbi:DUF5134 domain-containing protein [Nocardia implantans]|uniref:DUF5134 domain-containing protein n=1 Tax=Nocardia implantans TaxID=3108168 RepID=A0ABU6AZR5_9NOCA|nr:MULTISPECIES: DUF5134 domain-containing protein [unclassified Nocardia]MBF6195071.1 DUF5134 domain-containing protein [Nocardia beijingensis]MEA3530883.1 DUF5134 domain-containing protein [Nocardia sp. CDC192]MEB3512987.1 DUF5134 domain-containing protein [Nocardia sp. CDC186]
MAQFVQEYAVLRWMVVAAFVIAAGIVLSRVAAAATPSAGCVAQTRPPEDTSGGHAESDAAHLVMCLVMLGMLVFPSGASPHAVRGVLTAMAVVFAGLLTIRAAEHAAQGRPLPIDRLVPLGYHIVTTAAMLYAMSGHTASGHAGGPATGPALGLAVLFLLDALVVTFAACTGGTPARAPGPVRLLVRSGGCVAALTGPAKPWAAVPHVVMDAGTAYMLVAVIIR